MPVTYKKIASVTLTTTASNIEFTSIPATYTDLELKFSTRTDRTATAGENIRLRFNGDTSAVYSFRYLEGNSASASSVSGSSDTSMLIAYTSTDATTVSTFGSTSIYIPNYAGSTNKSVSSDSVTENNATSGGSTFVILFAGLWSNTSAINTIRIYPQLGPNFKAYSTATLYGISNS